MAQDSAAGGSDESHPGHQVAIFVDATESAGAGATVEYGPRVGPEALEAVLCSGLVRVVGLAQGAPVVTSNEVNAVPPAVRRFVAFRDNGCTADGCTSRYRLQAHHVRPRSRGGSHDPHNLRTLCWFHHHVLVHGYGYHIDPSSPPGRTRFIAPPSRRAPPRSAA